MVDKHKCPVDTFRSYLGVFRCIRGVIVQILQCSAMHCKCMILKDTRIMPKPGILGMKLV